MKKNTQSADFCADQIDVITIFAVIKNVIIKRVHCIALPRLGPFLKERISPLGLTRGL